MYVLFLVSFKKLGPDCGAACTEVSGRPHFREEVKDIIFSPKRLTGLMNGDEAGQVRMIAAGETAITLRTRAFPVTNPWSEQRDDKDNSHESAL